MKLSRRETERPRPSRVPSFLGHRRRQTLDTDSIRQPLIPLSRIAPKTRETEILRLKYGEIGLWRLPRRQRTLSIPPFEHEKGTENLGMTYNQSESWLFKLPKNVRSQIYSNVLGNRVLHIVRRHTKLGHKSCSTDASPEACLLAQCRGSKTEYGIYRDSGDGNLVQILQTCRKM